MNQRVFLRLPLALCTAGMLASGAVLRADDVTDQIDEAMKAYKENDFATAAQGLEAAAQLIRQKRAEGFKAYLPGAPAGWTAEDAASSAAGAGFFGGGVTAERNYTKGDASVSVKLVTDSPMLQGMLMLVNNPMFASSDGGKLERIKGQKAIVKHDATGKSGSINIVVAGSLLVTIEGSNVTAADLKLFAEAIDYAKIAAAL